MTERMQRPHHEPISVNPPPGQGLVSRRIVDLVVEATWAATVYGRAADQARRFWPPWTLRERRDAQALALHFAHSAAARVCLVVGEPPIPDLPAAWDAHRSGRQSRQWVS